MNTALSIRRLVLWICNRLALSFELDGLNLSDEDVMADLTVGCE
jgi:hypothetical protein